MELTVLLCVAVFALYTVQAFADKKSSQVTGADDTVLLFGIIKCGAGALLAAVFVLISFQLGEVSVHTVWISLLAGLAQGICTYLIIALLKRSTIIQVNLFMSAGVLVPTVLSGILFDEPVTLIKWLGIVLFLIAAALLLGLRSVRDLRMNGATAGLLLVLAVFYGTIMFCQKAYPLLIPKGSISLFSLLMYTTSTLVLTLMLLIVKGRRKRRGEVSGRITDKRFYILAVICACIVFSLNQTITLLSGRLPAALVFPLTNGAKLLIVALVAFLFYRERIKRSALIGMLLMAGAVYLLST